MSEDKFFRRRWRMAYGWIKTPIAAIFGMALAMIPILFCGASALFTLGLSTVSIMDAEMSAHLSSVLGMICAVSVYIVFVLWARIHGIENLISETPISK